jgi:hypothetical protein
LPVFRNSHETYIPAQQLEACTYPRFPRPHGHQERSSTAGSPPRQRPRSSQRLIQAVTSKVFDA